MSETKDETLNWHWVTLCSSGVLVDDILARWLEEFEAQSSHCPPASLYYKLQEMYADLRAFGMIGPRKKDEHFRRQYLKPGPWDSSKER